ncbi:MAG TPA: ABC transporter substrate-binding protein [Anaerolineales bacterium]|nr:ABC transporter substrate-binding protein [Anaerolineales bacterium]
MHHWQRTTKSAENIVIVFLVIALGSVSCSKRMEPITVAYSPFEATALFWIAQDQNYFEQNGLSVTPRRYETGAGSLDGLLNGEAHLVVGASEFPLVGKVLQKERIRSIGTIAKSEFIYLIGRKDRGIEKVSDLRGKRVGTTLRTIAHFFLGRFLELNGMHIDDITLVEVKTPEEWVNAVVNGEIDAVVTAQPYANTAKDLLGANAVVWSAQSSQPLQTQLISTDEWITGHPDLVNRFLKSLVLAEEYAIRNPAEAKAIVQKQLKLEAAYMDTVWSQNQFSLSLDQSLIAAMEDEARWMIENNLTTEKEVPDFVDYIYLDGLQAVKAEAVHIIH